MNKTLYSNQYNYIFEGERTYYFNAQPKYNFTDTFEYTGYTDGNIVTRETEKVDDKEVSVDTIYRKLPEKFLSTVANTLSYTEDWFRIDTPYKIPFILPQSLGEFAPYKRKVWSKAVCIEGNRYMCYLVEHEKYLQYTFKQYDKKIKGELGKTYTNQIFSVKYYPTEKQEFEDLQEPSAYVVGTLPRWGILAPIAITKDGVRKELLMLQFKHIDSEDTFHTIHFWYEGESDEIYVCNDLFYTKAKEVSDFVYEVHMPVNHTLYIHDDAPEDWVTSNMKFKE